MSAREVTVVAVAGVVAFVVASCVAPSTSVAVGTAVEVAEERHSQRLLALGTHAARQHRLDAVARPILRANAEFCPQKHYKIGFAWLGTAGASAEDQQALVDFYGVPLNTTFISAVYANTPAEAAGMEVGDVLVSVGDYALPAVVETNRKAKAVARNLEQRLDPNSAASVRFQVVRRGQQIGYTIAPELLCGYDAFLTSNDGLNAYTDGKAIYVTQGMVRFAENDQELQAVIAHELAHITEGHVAKKMTNAGIGAIFGAIVDIAAASQGIYTNTAADLAAAGSMAFSQEFEREADYVSIYMLQRTGVDTAAVANLWRRMAVESPGSIAFATSHPTSAERFVNLTAAHDEVTAKRLRNQPLLPDRMAR